MTPATMTSAAPSTTLVEEAITHACNRIAPAWPLDRTIAVNPFWGFVDAPIERAAAELTALSGATLLMPRTWYREQFNAGRFLERHVAQAIAITGATRTVAEVMATLKRDDLAPAPWRLMTDATDIGRDLGQGAIPVVGMAIMRSGVRVRGGDKDTFRRNAGARLHGSPNCRRHFGREITHFIRNNHPKALIIF